MEIRCIRLDGLLWTKLVTYFLWWQLWKLTCGGLMKLVSFLLKTYPHDQVLLSTVRFIYSFGVQ